MSIAYNEKSVRERVKVLLGEGHDSGAAFALANREEGDRVRHGRPYAELKADMLAAAERTEPPRAEAAQTLATAQRVGQSLPASTIALDQAARDLIEGRIRATSRKPSSSDRLKPASIVNASEVKTVISAKELAYQRLKAGMLEASERAPVRTAAPQLTVAERLLALATAYQVKRFSETGVQVPYRDALLAVSEEAG